MNVASTFKAVCKFYTYQSDKKKINFLHSYIFHVSIVHYFCVPVYII